MHIRSSSGGWKYDSIFHHYTGMPSSALSSIWTPSQVGRAMSWPRREQGRQTLRQTRCVCPSSVQYFEENVRLWISPYFESRKGRLTATQRYKAEERTKAISHDVFILLRRKAPIWLRPAQQNEETSWSALSLTCLTSVPFYSSACS